MTSVNWERCRGKSPLCPINCLNIQDPVCLADGKLFPNECIAQRANCGWVWSSTSLIWSDILTNLAHRKKLELKDRKFCFARNRSKWLKTCRLTYLLIDYRYGLGARKLDSNDGCPSECLQFYKPVCGSDGQVYMNECYLKKLTCKRNGKSRQDVTMVDMKRCVDTPKCPEMCVALPDPVCGSDGKVYLNHCRLKLADCRSTRRISRMPRVFCVGGLSSLNSYNTLAWHDEGREETTISWCGSV